MLDDVASALMYLGGRQNAASFWKAYVDHSPASSAELVDHLGALTRYRAAVQAASSRGASPPRTTPESSTTTRTGKASAMPN